MIETSANAQGGGVHIGEIVRGLKTRGLLHTTVEVKNALEVLAGAGDIYSGESEEHYILNVL